MKFVLFGNWVVILCLVIAISGNWRIIIAFFIGSSISAILAALMVAGDDE